MSKEEKDLELDRATAMANLTQEERDALADDDLSDEERAALADIAGDDDDDGDDAGADDDDDSGKPEDTKPETAVAAPVVEEKAVELPAAEKPVIAAPAAATDEDEDAGTVYSVDVPADLADRVAALDSSEADLAKKFKDGELEVDDYITQNRAITNERAQLERLRTQADTAAMLNEQNAKNAWARTVRNFMSQAAKDEGIDYNANEKMGRDLDNVVKALAQNQDNQDQPMRWYLEQAHKAVKAMHGIETKKPTLPGGKPDVRPKPASRKPSLEGLPPTLANVPGSDGPGDVGEDDYARLDKLEGLEFERAMARMTPAQQERYLSKV